MDSITYFLFFIFCFVFLFFCCVFLFFFFQAEDGIRDRDVTGVQTCALPDLNEYFEVFEIMKNNRKTII